MITVRFPNGHAITYNDANYLLHGSNCQYILKTSKEGREIAFIQSSAGVIVELDQPCRVYNPVHDKSIETLIKEVRALKRKITMRPRKGARR